MSLTDQQIRQIVRVLLKHAPVELTPGEAEEITMRVIAKLERDRQQAPADADGSKTTRLGDLSRRVGKAHHST